MSIYKPLLYEKIHKVLIRNSNKIDFDLDLVLYLLKVTIFTDPDALPD
jgi:hypothetical protein